mmetsp:Transcript_34525/g.51238  ORF Transcript_34525/g.51238 Transcript_34525/m.51238 type:complete len:234 (-) Transcript_34525:35-736(-)
MDDSLRFLFWCAFLLMGLFATRNFIDALIAFRFNGSDSFELVRLDTFHSWVEFRSSVMGRNDWRSIRFPWCRYITWGCWARTRCRTHPHTSRQPCCSAWSVCFLRVLGDRSTTQSLDATLDLCLWSRWGCLRHVVVDRFCHERRTVAFRRVWVRAQAVRTHGPLLGCWPWCWWTHFVECVGQVYYTPDDIDGNAVGSADRIFHGLHGRLRGPSRALHLGRRCRAFDRPLPCRP